MKSFLNLLFLYFNQIRAKKCFVSNYSTLRPFNYSTIIFILVINLILPVHAFEDYIITTNGKLSDISIEDNTIVDVFPLITIMNDKNTIMVSPLKIGKTRVCVLKNGKEKVMFDIKVMDDRTIIGDVKDFEILSLDSPQEEFKLDKPPVLRGAQ